MSSIHQSGFRISLDYGGQRDLRMNGIVIPASWWITKERQELLLQLGAQVPKPIEGHILLDTCQPHIAIDEKIAAELKLKPTGKTQEMYGAKEGEVYAVPYYSAQLMLPVEPIGKNNVARGTLPKYALGIPVEAWAISTLHHSYRDLKDKNGAPLKIIGILGRIFLQFTNINYNGLTGKVEIYIDQSARYPKKD